MDSVEKCFVTGICDYCNAWYNTPWGYTKSAICDGGYARTRGGGYTPGITVSFFQKKTALLHSTPTQEQNVAFVKLHSERLHCFQRLRRQPSGDSGRIEKELTRNVPAPTISLSHDASGGRVWSVGSLSRTP